MASWKYESKAGVLATDVDAEKVASLRVILRQGGDGRAANDVYNMSPAELRASVDEARLLDRNQLINELASLTGQSATDAETANEGASDTDLYDRVWDTQVKKKLWKLSGNDPDDYDGDDLSIEDFARHREAELWRAERDWVEERVREIDPNADQDDVSELTDDQLAEKLNELAAKAALGEEDNPLDPATIVEHKRAELRAQLDDLGIGLDETSGWAMGDLWTALENRSGSGSTEMGPPTPPDDAGPPAPPGSLPREGGSPSPPTGGGDGSPEGSSDDGNAPPGSPPTGATPPRGGDGTAPGGGDTGTGGHDGATGGDDGDQASGPPPGSTHYGYGIRDLSGKVIGGETGYRDENGDWYEADGSPMGAEKAERMEERYQNDELQAGSTVPDSSDGTSTGEESATSGEGESSDVDFTPDDDPDYEDIQKYLDHLPDQGRAPTRNEGAIDPEDPFFDDGDSTVGAPRFGQDSPSDPPDDVTGGTAAPEPEPATLGLGPDPTHTDPAPWQSSGGGAGRTISPGDVSVTPQDRDASHLVDDITGQSSSQGGLQPRLGDGRAEAIVSTGKEQELAEGAPGAGSAEQPSGDGDNGADPATGVPMEGRSYTTISKDQLNQQAIIEGRHAVASRGDLASDADDLRPVVNDMPTRGDVDDVSELTDAGPRSSDEEVLRREDLTAEDTDHTPVGASDPMPSRSTDNGDVLMTPEASMPLRAVSGAQTAHTSPSAEKVEQADHGTSAQGSTTPVYQAVEQTYTVAGSGDGDGDAAEGSATPVYEVVEQTYTVAGSAPGKGAVAPEASHTIDEPEPTTVKGGDDGGPQLSRRSAGEPDARTIAALDDSVTVAGREQARLDSAMVRTEQPIDPEPVDARLPLFDDPAEGGAQLADATDAQGAAEDTFVGDDPFGPQPESADIPGDLDWSPPDTAGAEATVSEVTPSSTTIPQEDIVAALGAERRTEVGADDGSPSFDEPVYKVSSTETAGDELEFGAGASGEEEGPVDKGDAHLGEDLVGAADGPVTGTTGRITPTMRRVLDGSDLEVSADLTGKVVPQDIELEVVEADPVEDMLPEDIAVEPEIGSELLPDDHDLQPDA